MKTIKSEDWLSYLTISLFTLFCSLPTHAQSTGSIVNFKIPSLVCEGQSITFENTSYVDHNDTATYQWHFENAESEHTTSPTAKWQYKGTTRKVDITLTMFLQTGDSLKITKEVTINELPVADFSVSDKCEGEEVAFTNKSSLSTGNISSLWSFGENTDTSNLFSPKYTYAIMGNTRIVSVTLITSSLIGCADTHTLTLTIYAHPDASFTAAANGKTVEFDGPPGNEIYHWRFDDGNTSSLEDVTHVYQDYGGYEVCLATNNGFCWSEECNLISVGPVSIEELTNQIWIAPNPVTDGTVNLNLNSASNPNKVQIYSLLGHYTNIPFLKTDDQSYKLDLNRFAAGIYIIHVHIGDEIYTQKVLLRP